MFETLFGGLLGGLLRLAPEVLKWLDRKSERRHEIEMFDRQLEADRLRGEMKMAQIEQEGQFILDAKGLEALKEGIKAQGVMSGVKWIDGLTQSVRPIVTYLILSLYLGAKASTMWVLYGDGATITAVLQNAYGESDMAILSGILNFWYLSRVFDKYGK